MANEVKFTDVIRCSSEDTLHCSANLLKGSSNTKSWLCSPSNKESTIEVELQFEKEAVVSFIDIGNHGSQTVDILVSHSTRSKNQFVSLVPAFNFMSVPESKMSVNTKKVQMFKSDEMCGENKGQSWDRLKLVCTQPYFNGKQFGLSFVCIKRLSSGEKVLKPKVINSNNSNQNKLNNFFDSLRNGSSLSPKSPKLSMWSSASPTVNKSRSPSTPTLSKMKSTVSPTDSNGLHQTSEGKPRVLSAAAIAQFKDEVGCFFEDINITELLEKQSIKVSHLRYQMEKQRGTPLIAPQKILFMELITEKLKSKKVQSIKKILQSKENAEDIPRPSPAVVESEMDGDVECKKCHTKLPKSIIAIHMGMCKKDVTPVSSKSSSTRTPNKLKTSSNRNRLCFDLGESSEDESDTPRKRTKIVSETPTVENADDLETPSITIPTPNTLYDHSNDKVFVSCHLDDNAAIGDTSPLQDQPNNSSSGEISNHVANDVINISEETSECPICFKQIAFSKIALHASSCEGNTDDSPDLIFNGNRTKGYSNKSSTNTVNIIDDDTVQCPLCGKMKQKENIEIHVNICLDFNSSSISISD